MKKYIYEIWDKETYKKSDSPAYKDYDYLFSSLEELEKIGASEIISNFCDEFNEHVYLGNGFEKKDLVVCFLEINPNGKEKIIKSLNYKNELIDLDSYFKE
jgi:hypothetical protein